MLSIDLALTPIRSVPSPNHVLQIFGGNMDIKTERRHYLNVPMVTRYLRIHPLTWRKRIGLRAGVIGCPHSGDCGPGFLKVNQRAGCGESRHHVVAILFFNHSLFQFRTRRTLARPG